MTPPLPHAPHRVGPHFGPPCAGPSFLLKFLFSLLSLLIRSGLAGSNFLGLNFFPTLCVFLQNSPLQSIPHRKVVLNSNFHTEIVYEAFNQINQHIFRNGGGRDIQTL
jgi:hypothetical protein